MKQIHANTHAQPPVLHVKMSFAVEPQVEQDDLRSSTTIQLECHVNPHNITHETICKLNGIPLSLTMQLCVNL